MIGLDEYITNVVFISTFGGHGSPKGAKNPDDEFIANRVCISTFGPWGPVRGKSPHVGENVDLCFRLEFCVRSADSDFSI